MTSKRFGSVKITDSALPTLLMTAEPMTDTTVSLVFTNLSEIADKVSLLYTNVNILKVQDINESDYLLYQVEVEKVYQFQPIVLEEGFSLYVVSRNGTTSVNAYGFSEEL